jgi:hypothetical protein
MPISLRGGQRTSMSVSGAGGTVKTTGEIGWRDAAPGSAVKKKRPHAEGARINRQ